MFSRYTALIDGPGVGMLVRSHSDATAYRYEDRWYDQRAPAGHRQPTMYRLGLAYEEHPGQYIRVGWSSGADEPDPAALKTWVPPIMPGPTDTILEVSVVVDGERVAWSYPVDARRWEGWPEEARDQVKQSMMRELGIRLVDRLEPDFRQTGPQRRDPSYADVVAGLSWVAPGAPAGAVPGPVEES